MLKTVKGKVIAGTVAVTLFAGAGAAFGASDAGENFRAWYDGQFRSASNDVKEDVTKYAGSKVPGLLYEYNGIRSDAAKEIKKSGETNTNTSKSNIQGAAQEHIDEVKLSHEEINGFLTGQFDALSLAAQKAIDDASTEVEKQASNDLDSHTGKKGEDALKYVNDELGTSKEQAIKDLNEAIATAKGDLSAKLKTEKGLTTTEIKGMIDQEIKDLRKIITDKKTELVAAQVALIVKKAADLELAAKAELDSIVSNINK